MTTQSFDVRIEYDGREALPQEPHLRASRPV
jgi:hypothetical protein